MERGKLAVLAVPLAGLLLLSLLACDTVYDPDVVQKYTEVRGTVRIPRELSPLLPPEEVKEGATVTGGQPGNCFTTSLGGVAYAGPQELPQIVADQPALVVKGEMTTPYGGGVCGDPGTVWMKFTVDKRCSLTISAEWNDNEVAYVPVLYAQTPDMAEDEVGFITWDLSGWSPWEFSLVASPDWIYHLRWIKFEVADPPTDPYTITFNAVSGTVVGEVYVGLYHNEAPYRLVPEGYTNPADSVGSTEAGWPKYPVGGSTVADLRVDESSCDEDGRCDLIGWFDGVLVPVTKCKSDADCKPPICNDLEGKLHDEELDPLMCTPSPCNNGYCSYYLFAFADNDGGNNLNFSTYGPPSSADFIMSQPVEVPGDRLNFKKEYKLYTIGELLIDSTVDDPDFDGVPNTDVNGDGLVDDNCRGVYNPDQGDKDGDGVGDYCDNCEEVSNPGQENTDGVGPGDACNQENDSDGDEIEYRADDEDDTGDNCPDVANEDQADLDNDGLGDACDDDIDADGIPNTSDFCPSAGEPTNADSDTDGIGDACDNCRGNMSDCLSAATWDSASDDPRVDWDNNWINCERVATMTAGECQTLDDMCLSRACSNCKPGATDCYGYAKCTESEVKACEDAEASCILRCDQYPEDREDLQLECYESCENKRNSCVGKGSCSQKKYDQCTNCTEICESLCASYLDLCVNNGALCENETNCSASNADQEDLDGDGIGDACDADIDGDGLLNTDNLERYGCDVKFSYETDTDGDGIPDGCDNCTEQANFGNPQADDDSDGVGNPCDNCPNTENSDQADLDEDGEGDACDADDDGDNVDDADDNCPEVANEDQADSDGDLLGDACDVCPDDSDPDQTDSDGDGAGDACDVCQGLGDDQTDSDGDGLGNACDPDDDGDGYCDEGVVNPTCTAGDNCPDAPNPDQLDLDNNGVGDICDADADADGIIDGLDICPNTPTSVCNFFVTCAEDEGGASGCNATGHCIIHPDADHDGFGDACDPCPNQAAIGGEEPDADGDMVGDNCGDNCPDVPNPDQLDTDNDTFGNACDSDDDNDGFDDPVDNCPINSNTDQDDDDGDGVGDTCDNCPADANSDQGNVDGDSQGDVCDDDADNDGIFDNVTGSPCTGGATTNCDDNCPLVENPLQTDANGNGVGDDCEEHEVVTFSEQEPNMYPDYNDIGTLSMGIPYRIYGFCSEAAWVDDPNWPWIGDEDWFAFEVDTAGTIDLAFDWFAVESDYDILVYMDAGGGLEFVNQDAATGAQPEYASFDVSTGVVYYVIVLGFEGDPSIYFVDMELGP